MQVILHYPDQGDSEYAADFANCISMSGRLLIYVSKRSKNTKKKATGCIKDKNRNILFNQEEIAARWVKYITELYEDNKKQMPKFEVTSGASIMKEEIQKALKSMKDGKATGTDELPEEALKALDEHNIEIITSLCNIIYNSGMIPTEMKHCIYNCTQETQSNDLYRV